MQTIVHFDQALLRLINVNGQNPFFDAVLPFLRNAEMWVPLYFFLILLVVFNCKQNAFWWILFAAITIIVTNYISSDLIKGNIFRLRPCNDPAIAGWIRILPGLHFPQSSSFTSSHASNHFAMAMFFFSTLKNVIGKWAWLFFAWAASICYAQLYVAVHYPTDIICGALLGLLLGYISSKIFYKKWGPLLVDTTIDNSKKNALG